MNENEAKTLLKLSPLSQEDKERIEWIEKILKIRVTKTTSDEKHNEWFDELYEKSLTDLKIFYNVFK